MGLPWCRRLECWCSAPTLRCHTIVAKSYRAAQVSDTVEFRHHNLTQATVTLMDRIVYGVDTLTCALHEAPTIACDNQLAAIQALHQAIQRWAKPTLTVDKKPQVTTPRPTRTQQRSILRPICSPNKCQPQDLLSRVVVQKPNASP